MQTATPREEALMKEIEAALAALRWPTRVTRTNIGTDPDRRAFVLGKVRKLDVHDRLVTSQFNAKFPDLFAQLKRLVHMHDPAFRFNAIQLNANVQTETHVDRNNKGASYCLGLGTYTGGGLVIYPPDHAPVRFANRRKWVRYDGSKLPHASIPVTAGTRYAVIFYTATPQQQRARSRARARTRSRSK